MRPFRSQTARQESSGYVSQCGQGCKEKLARMPRWLELLLLLLLLLCGLLGQLEHRYWRRLPRRNLVEMLNSRVVEGGTNAHVHRKALPGMAFINASHGCYV